MLSNTNDNGQQRWLWVTRPEYYLNEDGSDRADLDPAEENDASGWWTCHRDTRKGDSAFLWRTSPKKDIGYLIQVESDAYSIADDDYASGRGWTYGCDYRVLHKFAHPVTIQDLRDDPVLCNWGAYRAQFRRRVFRIAQEYWERLNQLTAEKNPAYREFVGSAQQQRVRRFIELEEELEEALVDDLGLLKKFGYDLELYSEPDTGRTGRQYVCRGQGGRMDLLCHDHRENHYVVVELKNVRASRNTFGQICSYMGWVQERIAGSAPVFGLVISRGCDAKFESALRTTDRVSRLDIEQLGFG